MAQKQSSSQTKSHPKSSLQPSGPAFLKHLPAWGMFLLGFLLYANTFSHQYALDDAIVITDNIYTQEGFGGIGDLMTHDAFTGYFKAKKNLVAGGRYRPLSMVTFAIEIELFGKNAPQVSHIINAILYGFTCLILYLLLLQWLQPSDRSKWWMTIPFIVALLFAVHPLHTEVVANIKGRDELMALLFSLLAFRAFFNWWDTQKVLSLVLSAVFLFLGILSKESAVPFVVLIPLGIWFFRNMDTKRLALGSAPLMGAFALYLVLRSSFAPAGSSDTIPNEILNDPFLHATYGQQLATVMVTFGKYLQLLFAPISLSHDYYFNQIPVADWSELRAFGPALLTLGMVAVSIMGLLKKNLLGFGLIFYFATLFLVSNIIFPIGTTMGERFVFIPSIGFLLAIIWVLQWVGQKWLKGNEDSLPTPIWGLLVLVAVLFAGRTISRNPVWENNETLFLTDVEVSSNSAKLQTAAGGTLFERGNTELSPKKEITLQQALVHLDKAIQIYPEHGMAHFLKGNSLFALNRFQEAASAFSMAIFHRPSIPNGMRNLAVARYKAKDYQGSARTWITMAAQTPDSASRFYVEAGNAFVEIPQPDSAIYFFDLARQKDPSYPVSYAKMGMVYARYLQNFAAGIEFMQQAIAHGDQDPGTWENMGIAYAMTGNAPQAIATFQEGLKKHPNAANLYFNLAVAYQNLGEAQKAEEAMTMARKLDPIKFK